MPGPSILVRVLGDLAGLTGALKETASKGQSAASALHSGFSTVLGALNKTGVLGPFGEAFDGIDDAIGKVLEHGKSIGPAMAGVGTAVAGIGVSLSALGSKDKAAHQQLQAAVEATGHSYDDYEKQVESAISKQEKFGHTANETQDALRVLTQATNDPAKALQLLGTASDLAAAKHEDLTSAATQMGKVYNGNTKILKEFGVVVGTSAKQATSQLESATKAATSADAKAAEAKQKLTDLQARLAVGNHAAAVSTAGVTSAQIRLSDAQRHLNDLMAEDASKKKLTLSQQFALRDAHMAVTRATEGVAAAQGKYSAAETAAVSKGHLTVAQQQQLRNAQDAVTKTSAAAQAAHKKLADAQTTAGKAAHGQTDALNTLGAKLKGQASASADTFGGRIAAVRAHLEDLASNIGQKYGPAITGVGTAMAGVGGAITAAQGIMKTFAGAQKDVQVAAEGITAAQDAEAVSSWLALGPILLIIAAIAALVAIAFVIYKNWNTIWKAMKAVVVDAWNWIKANWPLLLAIILGPIALAALEIAKHWKEILAGVQAVWHWLAAVWGQVYSFITAPVAAAISWIVRAFGGLVAWFAGIPGAISRIAAGMWHGVSDAFGVVLGALQRIWAGISGWFAGIPGSIARLASGMWHGITDAFRGAINALIDIWNRLHFTLPKISAFGHSIGGGTIGVPSIPHLAEGGLMTASGLVFAHAGEVISPAPASVRSGPAVAVANAHFYSGVDVETFMRKAAWIVQTQRV